MSYLAAKEVFEEKEIKGYNVRVKHPIGNEADKMDKSGTIADVILKSVRRLKKDT